MLPELELELPELEPDEEPLELLPELPLDDDEPVLLEPDEPELDELELEPEPDEPDELEPDELSDDLPDDLPDEPLEDELSDDLELPPFLASSTGRNAASAAASGWTWAGCRTAAIDSVCSDVAGSWAATAWALNRARVARANEVGSRRVVMAGLQELMGSFPMS